VKSKLGDRCKVIGECRDFGGELLQVLKFSGNNKID
jgi:hypothetical protein